MSCINQLATHLPDQVVYTDHSRQPAYVITREGVLMFADVSGFTSLTEKYSMNAKNGTDQLTKTLNNYLGSIVECIINSDGDVLKYAGDAILATWPVETYRDLPAAIVRVIKCGLSIQVKCGEYMTDVGVKLRVKIGIAAGQFSIIFMGNNEFRHYVTVGRAVNDVNKAETFCESGYVVVSPSTWMMCPQHENILYEAMSDDAHMRVVDVFSVQSCYKISHTYSVKEGTEILKKALDNDSSTDLKSGKNPYTNYSSESTEIEQNQALAVPQLGKSPSSVSARKAASDEMAFLKTKTRGSRVRRALFISKQASNVALNLNAKLRLYVAEPVLRKMDAGQPLEYLSEMRQVTIVFMNMSLKVMSRQEQSQLIQTAYILVHRHLKSTHGCLNKVFMFDKGCTFLAIFGLPGYKHENDCAHALQCAFRMKKELDRNSKIVNTSIGVTTGSTFCGVVGHKHRHEYTVIGRKVNMAARLMMYYPHMVTCDNETFHHSRLGKMNFTVLEAKTLKGLQNVGTVREYKEKNKSMSSNMDALLSQEIQYPLLGREREMNKFLEELNTVKADSAAGWQRRTIIFEGDSGTGKTRMLDSVILCSLQENIRVISCTVTLHDSRVPFHTVCTLVMQLLGLDFEQTHQEREHTLLNTIKDRAVRENLFILNDLLQLKLPPNENYKTYDRSASLYPGSDKVKQGQGEKHSDALHSVLYRIVHEVTCKFGNIIFAIDDAHLMDAESWEFIADLGNHAHSLCVLTLRIQQMVTVNTTAMSILSDPYTMIIKLDGLADEFVSPLICQLLDVNSIPVQLESLLRRKTHGIPSWCEQILRQLYHDQIIIIVDRKNLDTSDVGMIVPDKAMLGKHLQDSAVELQKDQITSGSPRVSPAPSENSILKQLGLDSKKGELKESKSMICLVAPGKSLDKIGLPDSMRGMIQTQIDRMGEMEQMVIKCAAIIGMTFPRQMLEAIVPVNDPDKLNSAINKLMDRVVLTCASAMNASGSSDNRTFGARVACKCPSRKTSECQLLNFTSASMRETAYGMFIQRARKELHIKAAHYLESQAHKCPACGGGEFIPGHHMGSALNKMDEEMEGKRKRSLRRKRVSLFGPQQKFTKTFQRDRRDSVPTSSAAPPGKRVFKDAVEKVIQNAKFTSKVGTADSDREVDTLLEHEEEDEQKAACIDVRGCECLSILSRVYPQLVFHWRAAGNVARTIHFLAESGAAAIALHNNMQALSFLNEAVEIINCIQSGKNPFEGETNDIDEKKIEKEEQARVYSLIGQALFHMGDAMDSLPHFYKALRKLSNRQPTSKLGIKFKILTEGTTQKFHRTFPGCYIGSSKKSVNKSIRLIEQSRCLSHVFHYFVNTYQCTQAYMTVLQQVNRAECANTNLHELLMSYSCMIQCYQLMRNFNLASEYEKLAIQRCMDALDQMDVDDTVTIAHLYCVSLSFRLTEGRSIPRAIESGYAANAFTEKLHDNDLKLQMLPMLAQALLLANRISHCVEILESIKYTYEETDDNLGEAWYFVTCSDLIMEAGFHFEPFSRCLTYAKKALVDPVFINNTLPVYLLSSSLALWFGRRHSWSESEKWHGFAKVNAPMKMDNYGAMHGLCKIIELKLLSYCSALRRKDENASSILKDCKAELQQVEAACDQVPVMMPRYMHLTAYALALEKKQSACEKLIQECLNLCRKTGNVLEEQWITHSKQVWFSASDTKRNSFWSVSTVGSLTSLDWQMAKQVDGSVIKYSLPLPDN